MDLFRQTMQKVLTSREGVPLVKVMAIVGHKKMETTDIYLRLAGVDIKGATDALGYSAPIAAEQENVISVNFSRQ